MAVSFYFYDLETSGVTPKRSRIMQFAGQRTDENLVPIGEPDDVLIKLSPDILPDPEAILLTGITPQKTISEGLSEAEFLKFFTDEITTPDTIFLGFNTIRFDDEFMRYLHFRNYYDPYEWQYKDNRSKWDMLDVVRMMRALRPEGLNWPVATDGTSTNRLESLTSINNIEHSDAHTALSDVNALIELTQKITTAQPKLFNFLLTMRSKQAVKDLVLSGSPFVYTSGSYEGRYEKTTIAIVAAELEDGSGALVYDTRYSLDKWQNSTLDEIRDAYTWDAEKTAADRPPFKIMHYNRCPAIAPLSVLDAASRERLELDVAACIEHSKEARSHPELLKSVITALTDYRVAAQQQMLADDQEPDTRLYDGFIPKADYPMMRQVQIADAKTISEIEPHFHDHRLEALWPLYKARNYPKQLTADERRKWENHIETALFGGKKDSPYAKFTGRLEELAKRQGLTKQQTYVLEELRLYAESIAPY